LKTWVVAVLQEYDFDETMIMGSTAASRSAVKRSLDVCIRNNWEWCFLSLANCALIEGTGSSKDPQKSQNIEFQKLYRGAKKLCKLFSKSDSAKDLLQVLGGVEDGTKSGCASLRTSQFI